MYYDLQDSEQSHSPPTKRPITEVQAGSSESFKRARIEHEPEKTLDATEHEGPSDTPAADTGQGKRDAAGWAKSRRGKAKDTKNKGRRRGTRDHKDGEKEGEEQSPRAPRLPKKQSALLIGFCGTGCNGMQIQPDVRTIEGVLFDALVRAGAVSSDNADDPVKVNLGRAARTDAGVHAAGNLVSMKLITTIPGVTDWVARVNEELPQEIRVWGSVCILSFSRQELTMKWFRSACKIHLMLACLATAASTHTSSRRISLYLQSLGQDFSVHMKNTYSPCRALSL